MSTTIKVIGYHIDAFGHVNNARYLSFWRPPAGTGWKATMLTAGSNRWISPWWW